MYSGYGIDNSFAGAANYSFWNYVVGSDANFYPGAGGSRSLGSPTGPSLIGAMRNSYTDLAWGGANYVDAYFNWQPSYPCFNFSPSFAYSCPPYFRPWVMPAMQPYYPAQPPMTPKDPAPQETQLAAADNHSEKVLLNEPALPAEKKKKGGKGGGSGLPGRAIG